MKLKISNNRNTHSAPFPRFPMILPNCQKEFDTVKKILCHDFFHTKKKFAKKNNKESCTCIMLKHTPTHTQYTVKFSTKKKFEI